jgi:hypothetical protein
MAFRRNRKSEAPGPNPGLTPIDDIHGGGSVLRKAEPDRTTGRLRAQDDESTSTTSKTKPTVKRSGRHS